MELNQLLSYKFARFVTPGMNYEGLLDHATTSERYSVKIAKGISYGGNNDDRRRKERKKNWWAKTRKEAKKRYQRKEGEEDKQIPRTEEPDPVTGRTD